MQPQPDPAEVELIEGGPWIDPSNPTRAARALFFGILLLMAGNGLQGSLIGLRSEAEGFGVATAGTIMALYFAGFLVGSRWAEFLLSQVGHIRVFAGLASTASAAVLMHALFISPVTWGAMRFVTGVCMAGLYVVAESWLNHLATNETRGRILSVYMVVTMGGMTVGQFLLDAADPDGFELFMLSSVLVSASLVPVALSASSAPPLSVPEAMSLRELFGTVPTGIVAAFWNGATAGVLLGLGAVYAVTVDIPDSRIPAFLAAPLFGSILLQWPIGYISDRVSRRAVILWVALAAAATSVALAVVEEGSWPAIGLMLLLGATSFPIYSLTLAYTADWLPQTKLTAGSALLIRVNGVGALLGPLAAAILMSIATPAAFFWTMASTNIVIVVYLIHRMVVKDALPVERQRRFVAFPARASAVATQLIYRRRR